MKTDFLSSEFTALATGKAISIAEFILKYQIMHLVVFAATGVLATHFAKKNLEKGRTSKNRAPVGHSEYFKAGIRRNGIELTNQRLRSDHEPIDLEKVFDPKYSKKIIKYFNEAAKFCTLEEPIVFQHLDKVIPSNKYEASLEMIARDWYNCFGPNLRGALAQNQNQDLGEREYYEEKTTFPLLLSEETAGEKQFKVQYIPESMLEAGTLPHPNNVGVEEGDVFIYDPTHMHVDRLRSNIGILNTINKDPYFWRQNFGVKHKTGRILSMEQPPPAIITIA